MRTLILALLLAAAVAAAPAPLAKPRQVLPGNHTLLFGSVPYAMTLTVAGHYTAGKGEWYGSWNWDAGTRTMVIHETTNGRTWTTYVIFFDGRSLIGKTLGGTTVEIRSK